MEIPEGISIGWKVDRGREGGREGRREEEDNEAKEKSGCMALASSSTVSPFPHLLHPSREHRAFHHIRLPHPLPPSLPFLVILAAYHSLLLRRGQGREPVQYLVGSWDFHRVHLLVLPPVLIPRPETEELVEWVLEEEEEGKREGGKRPLRFLDIGCGTGAIGLALLKAFKEAAPAR